MDLLAFKLLAAPLLLLAASLAIRRWGESVGGWIVGLPLTSGPISLFLALERGPAFAAQATSGSLAGTAAQAAFGLAWCGFAHRGWPTALAAACAAFAIVAFPLQRSGLAQGVLFVAALASVATALRFSPRGAPERVALASPWWDLPARMALIVVLVVGVTAIAPFVGPEASGALATIPFMGITLAVFAHRSAGPPASRAVMRGMVAGLAGFAVFFYALALALPRLELVAAYGCAVAATLVTQALSLAWMRRDRDLDRRLVD